MIKRLIAISWALALVLAACGEAAEDTTTTDAPPAETTTTAAEEPTTTTAEEPEACGPQHPALHEPGKLTVATGEPVFPPWMLDDDPAGGEGFENGVVYALAAELGFDAEDVEWVRTTFDEAIAPGDRPYDFNIQQYSITEDRQEVVDFSVPYYEVEKALVTLPGSPGTQAESMADLAALNYGAAIGTTDLEYIENVIGATDVDVFDELADVFLAMEGGQVEATVVGLPTALFATAVQVPDAVIAAILPRDDRDAGYGMLFTKGNPFVACVDQALESLRAQGVLDALADEWLAGGGEIPRITG